jgi:hypothetical protein
VIADLYEDVIAANRIENSERRMLKLKKLLHELPEHNFETFRFLAQHLNKVASREEHNKVCKLVFFLSADLELCFCLTWRYVKFQSCKNKTKEVLKSMRSGRRLHEVSAATSHFFLLMLWILISNQMT